MTLQLTSLIAVLEFTNLPMLGWLAAATLPWLIHRFYRQQHRTTPWAAVELLLSAMQQRARRVELQQWLLLAVRTAILVLVAVAVAEPTRRPWAIGAGAEVQTHRMIVLDQSYSMGCREQGTSRWQRAQSHARRWVEDSDGDALTLIGWSDQAENLLGRPTFNQSAALSAIENLRLSHASASLQTVARSLLAAIDRAEAELPQVGRHEIVFCTDLSQQTWDVDEQQWQLLESISKKAQVKIERIGGNRRLNIAVESLTIEPSITLLQRQTMVTATLRCFGEAPTEKVQVEFIVNGQVIDQQQVQLKSNDGMAVRATYRFLDEGAQTVEVVLSDNADGLPTDDSRWLIVDVKPKLAIACFAGRPGAADDLVRALAPSDRSIESKSALEPEQFSISQLGEMDLSKYVAVLISGVAELSSREAAGLKEYVEQGGGLAVFLGAVTTDPRSDHLQKLLPVTATGLQPAGDYQFEPLKYRHKIVSPFRGQKQSGLLKVAVSQYSHLRLPRERPSLETVLKFNTGDPALVVDRLGLGRIAVSALPASLSAQTESGTPWSSFALSPSFLPVVRELVTYLVGNRWFEQRNLFVGQAVVFPWTDAAEVPKVRLPSGMGQLLLPPSAEDRGQLVFQETSDPGVYRFQVGEQERARFAINLDGRDSDLTSIDPSTLPIGISASKAKATVTLPADKGNFSWVRPLLAIAMLLLLLEIGLAWQLGRGGG